MIGKHPFDPATCTLPELEAALIERCCGSGNGSQAVTLRARLRMTTIPMIPRELVPLESLPLGTRFRMANFTIPENIYRLLYIQEECRGAFRPVDRVTDSDARISLLYEGDVGPCRHSGNSVVLSTTSQVQHNRYTHNHRNKHVEPWPPR